MSTFDRIAASSPINRTAAVVTGGNVGNGELSPSQKRENLVSRVKQLERAIKAATNPEEKRALGLLKKDVQTAIQELGLRVNYPPNFGSFFMDVAREMLQPAMFRLIKDVATKRWSKETNADV
jgi:hypothetical protein